MREIREIKIMCCIAQLIETENTADDQSGQEPRNGKSLR